jgi:hypothetical protein
VTGRGSRRLTREERLALVREILARLDARRDTEQLRSARQMELFSPEQPEES